jgi:anti-sigma factor RsiW
VTEDSELLQRYLDGDLSPEQGRAFHERIASSPELQRELTELQLVGSLVRGWAQETGERAASLVQPTLSRVEEASAQRTRHASLGMAVAAVLLLVLPSSGQEALWLRSSQTAITPRQELAPPVAIERLEAGEGHAEVFVIGQASTPVVWLADEGLDEPSADQDPG